MNLISKRNYFLGFSFMLVVVCWLLAIFFGLRQGIDLRGGAEWQVTFENQNINEEMVRNAIKDNSNLDISVKRAGDSLIIRLADTSEEAHHSYLEKLKALGNVTENNFSSIGPAIGSELKTKAIWAIIFVLFGISIYIAFAFRKVSKPVSSWKYGVVTLITLFHDISIPVGLLAILGKFKGIEIDTNFIVALLVVMGFSVHDTIVVFDRIRENLILNRGKNIPLDMTINQSVKETIVRSINTSLTLILVLLALIFFGPASLFYFILTILIGTIFGTYSSIFIASPLLYLWGRGK